MRMKRTRTCPPRRRKRRRIDSGATENRKKVHTRSSTTVQAQNQTARESTVSQSSPADTESILRADYHEYPFRGIFKRVRIGRETTFNLEFTLLDLPGSFKPSIDLQIAKFKSSGERVIESTHPQVCASHAAEKAWTAPLYTQEDN